MGASLSDRNLKFVFVVGPTASGKSQWALEQAEKFQGSIVNIDSVQFYQGLEVGSAAPTAFDLKQVPHYLYSYVHAPNEMTAGNYLRDFYNLMESKKIKGPVFIVGGTGFYVQALEKGMYDLEPADLNLREAIETELSEKGAFSLFNELSLKDPKHQIHINDHYRLVRAIEILRATGETPTLLKERTLNQQNKNSFPYPFIKIGFALEKEIVLPKVKARTEYMLKNGIIEETKRAIDQGFQNWAPLTSVGFKEVSVFLKHNSSEKELLENIVTSTMQLIKKQKTWFKRDSAILWSDATAQALKRVQQDLDLFLNCD